MKALYLTKKSDAFSSFETRETERPTPQKGQVLIEVQAFGLNYADVMARLGLYPEMPPMPAILGYDVVGDIVEIGEGVTDWAVGDHVVALTRFGGYAEYALADTRACIHIERTMPAYQKLALATQLSTAYNATMECAVLHPQDIVLVYAAAGGVGLGIVQIALSKGCRVIAVASSDEKLAYLQSLGVEFVINYKKQDILETLKQWNLYHQIDYIFDSVGGDYVRKGMKALQNGGKYILFGASKLSGKKNKLEVLFEAMKFGLTLYSPPQFLMPSKSLIGINMLAIADNKPEVIRRCMQGAYTMYQSGVLKNIAGRDYPIADFAQAQDDLERGKTIGKSAILWR